MPSDVSHIDQAGTPRTQTLYAVFDSEREAAQAEQALAGIGVAAQRLQGSAEALKQPEAEAHGLTGVVTRMFKSVGGESLEGERYAMHVDQGRVVLTMPCLDQATADQLTKVLVPHGAWDVTYFGGWTIQHMSPGENAAHGMPTYEASTTPEDYRTGDITSRT
jgi:hypothetical protein